MKQRSSYGMECYYYLQIKHAQFIVAVMVVQIYLQQTEIEHIMLISGHNCVFNILCNTSDDIVDCLTIDFENNLASALIEALISRNVENDLTEHDALYLMYKNLSNPNALGINCGEAVQ